MKQENKKIFVIEDNESISKAIINSLENNFNNIDTYVYKSAEKALGNISQNPDYIILDHFLEKTNGIDCIPVFKEFLPDTKIIVVSSQNDINVFQNAFIYGANEYFRKDNLLMSNITEFIAKDIESLKEGWFNKIADAFKSEPKTNRPKVVFILDDNKNTSFSIEHMLSIDSKNHVFSFTDSKSFLEELEKVKPDFAILDYNLGEAINGKDVLAKLSDTSPKTQVIMFSGQTNVVTASELLKAGASYYLTKSKENFLRLKSIID